MEYMEHQLPDVVLDRPTLLTATLEICKMNAIASVASEDLLPLLSEVEGLVEVKEGAGSVIAMPTTPVAAAAAAAAASSITRPHKQKAGENNDGADIDIGAPGRDPVILSLRNSVTVS